MNADARQIALDAIAQEVRTHSGCGSEPCETCTRRVPGEGSPTAAVVFVGEAPGASEDRTGRPFVGRAGRLLDTLLEEMGLRRDAVFITNVVKARPPGNRDPRAAEVEHHRPWLERQLEIIAPELVVPLGRHALRHFDREVKVTAVHGTRIARRDGPDLFPLHHPSAGLRDPRVREILLADARALRAQLG